MMKITPRDKIFLIVGLSFLFLFVLLKFALFPLIDKREKMDRGIIARDKAIVEMRELQVRYRQLHGKANSLADQLAGREQNFSLFSFLEQMAAKTDVKKNIAYMKPSETADDGPFKEMLVEMKLQTVNLKKLIDFLQLVESPEKIVALKRISIQENKKEKATLDVIMQVVSLDINPDAVVK